ncbi:hypothetical protein L6R52_30245 [Myxococcota bacterium]|nr:hypothetical protein [Myxococcota bacterium]
MRSVVRALFAMIVSLVATTPASAATRTYLLVIGENHSLDPGVGALEYADDDAAKNWEMFSVYAERSALFAVLDQDTMTLHPEAARIAEVPERAAIFERLARWDRMMAEDLARGDDPELLLLYAGHGDVDERGEGYVTLHDAKLTRGELYRDIIGVSKARFVHVVVDACKSYFLVKSRGGPWKDDSVADDRSDEAVRALLLDETLDRYPRAGVIVATSGDQETHEWSRFRGGILSHQLRSALSGAADVNADGRIEYSEVRAFLAAANARVKHAGVRLETFARPPTADRRRQLVAHDQLPAGRAARTIHFGAALSGHYAIEDERGVRYVDLNKDSGTALDVLLPAGRGYFVRRDDVEEVELPAELDGPIELAASSWSKVALAARGSVDQSFRRELYRVPYGRRFYDGFVSTSGDLPVEDVALANAGAGARGGRGAAKLGVGYSVGGAPIAELGPSHAFVLRASWVREVLGVGLALELGRGRGELEGRAQALDRVAVLATLAFTVPVAERLSLFVEGAAGWQVLSGAFDYDGRRIEGAEGRSVRAELVAGASWWLVRDAVSIDAGLGLALDGIYSPLAYTSAVEPLLSLGLSYRP